MTAPINLTPEQEMALGTVAGWYRGGDRSPQVLKLFGPAGTGKTTLAKFIPALLGVRAEYAAYTGKAARVLASKGCNPSGTIHSRMYLPNGTDTDENGKKSMRWEWQEFSDFANCDLIILDEVSMVNEGLAMHLELYGKKIIVLGDPAQLPPVFGEGFYITEDPDILLQEIHRQALESPVLALATRLRQGGKLEPADFSAVDVHVALAADQVLCWTNKRRWGAIKLMRSALGYPLGTPVAGDRIMCLRNNRELGVYNGQQFTVMSVDGWDEPNGLGLDLVRAHLKDDEGIERSMALHTEGFQGLIEQRDAEKNRLGMQGGIMLATFAQAVTVHKAQGSEWKNVVIMNDWMDMDTADMRRWLYTAISRASDSVVIQQRKGM